jgi:outer membrane protein
MKNIFRGTLCVYVSCLGLSAHSYADNLKDVMATAYVNNPTLAAGRASLRATDENINQATAGWRPTVSASADISAIKSTVSNQGFSQTGPAAHPKTLGVNLKQNLFNGFQTVNGTKAAKSQSKAGAGRLVETEQQILLAVVTSFMDVKRDEEILEITVNNVIVLSRQLQASKDRFEVGEITKTDVAQSKARHARSLSERIRAEAALSASRSAYRRVVGNAPATLDDVKTIPNLPGTEDEALAIAQTENPLLVSARYIEEAAGHSVSASEGGLMPRIDLNASYGRTWDRLRSGDNSTVKSIGASLVVPIYQAGAQSSRIRQSKEIRNQRRLEMVATGRQVNESVRNAWEGFRETTARIRSSEDQVEANKIALDGVKQEADVGSRTILDVLNAEQEYLDARVSLARAERDRMVAAYGLLKSVGGLTAEKLNLNVPYYDANEHAESVSNKIYGFSVKE